MRRLIVVGWLAMLVGVGAARAQMAPADEPGSGDRDRDGVLDRDDRCPDEPGPRSNGGCPVDRDRDGIPDREDACPDVPGVRSSDPKANGCPPPEKKPAADASACDEVSCVLNNYEGACCAKFKKGGGNATKPEVKATPATPIVESPPPKRPAVANPPVIAATPPVATARARPEPTGYRCGGGTLVFHIGCTCAKGRVEARDDDNVALCVSLTTPHR